MKDDVPALESTCLYILKKFSLRIVFVADLFCPSITKSNGCADRSIQSPAQTPQGPVAAATIRTHVNEEYE